MLLPAAHFFNENEKCPLSVIVVDIAIIAPVIK